MKKIYTSFLFLSVIGALLLTSCGGKQNFDEKNLVGEWMHFEWDTEDTDLATGKVSKKESHAAENGTYFVDVNEDHTGESYILDHELVLLYGHAPFTWKIEGNKLIRTDNEDGEQTEYTILKLTPEEMHLSNTVVEDGISTLYTKYYTKN